MIDDPAVHDDSCQARFASALLDPTRACPPGLRTWNGSDPARRLAVYRNNVLSSLIDALADTFPVTQQLTGVAFFRAMAAVFVRSNPPRTRILAHYGDAFASFLTTFDPAANLPYLPDLARLEYARLAATHAADIEPMAPIHVSGALADADRLAGMRLIWHPSMHLIDSPFAVVSIWAAHQSDDEPDSLPIAPAERAIILRDGLDVLVIPASVGLACFVSATLSGLSFGASAERACESDASFDLGASLSLLIGHHALVGLGSPFPSIVSPRPPS